jgi:sugar phosphate isomerase/epimerase
MSPRLAAISDDLSTDFGDAARLAAELGLSGLAVRHVGGRNISELDRSAVATVRRTADQHGLDISAVSSPLGRGLSLDDEPSQAGALLDQMIAYADVLGTNLVRFFACWIPGKEAVGDWWERPDLTAALPRLVDRVGAFTDRAERAGVSLMLELEGASYVGQVAEAHALMAEVGSPSLALCWDVCNGWWSGEHPVATGLELAMRLPLVDVQVKDVRARSGDPDRPDQTQVALGSGDIDYATIISALRRKDYGGWYTAERVYHPRRPEVERPLQDAMIADLRQLNFLLT